MKLKHLFLVFLALAGASFAQNVRYDAAWPSVSSTSPPFLVANVTPGSPVLAVCKSPANQVPCTNFATTYQGNGASCPNGAQDTPNPGSLTSACQPTGDATGNIGFWAAAGTYDYTVCIGYSCYGPYTVTLGGSGGGGGSGSPNQSISFTSSNSVVLATSFTTSNLVWECYDNANPANTIYPANVTVNPSTFSVTFTFTIAQSGYCVVNGSGGGGGGGSGFTASIDLSGTSTAQQVIGMHFGATAFSLSTSTPPSSGVPCLGYISAGTIGGIACGGGSGSLPASVPFLATNGSSVGIQAPLAAGSQVAGGFGTNLAVAQTKAQIDVRDWGVSCTGAAGDAAILNSHTNTVDAITGQTIQFPNSCVIKLTSQWLIYGSEGWKLQGGAILGAAPQISFCGTSSGVSSTIKIERSGGWTIDGLTITSTTFGCSNPSAAAVIVDNDSSGGYTTTDGLFNRVELGISSTGGTIANWVGLSISPVAVSNVEDIRLVNSHVFCNGSSNSTGAALNGSFNAKMEEFYHTQFSSCTSGIASDDGDLLVIGIDSGGNGSVVALGPGSDPAYIAKITSEDNQLLSSPSAPNWPTTIISSHVGWNGASSAGLCGFDFGGGGNGGNYILTGSGSDTPPTGAFPLCGSVNTKLTMIGDQFNGVTQSGNSGFILPSGHQISNNYGLFNAGRLRVGQAAADGNEDIGYGFFTQFGVDLAGYAFNAQSADDGSRGGSLNIGKDVMYLGDANITLKGMWPIPQQSIAVTYTGTPGSTHWTVLVFAKDAAGNRGGWEDFEGNSGTFGAASTLTGSNFLTVVWPRVTRAVSYDVVLMNPSNPTIGELISTVSDPGSGAIATTTITSGSTGDTFNYVFPNYYDSAVTTINGESLTVNAPTTMNGNLIVSGVASSPNTSPICPNGTGGAFTTSGCSAGGGGGGGGNPTLDNCTPDQTGNSFYSVTSLTNYFYAGWQFIFNTATYINCTVYIPAAQAGATIVLGIAANDATAGHTASFQTCDGVINSGSINTGALTCAAAQTFTTTSTAYNRMSLTFNVQSTLANGSMLVVKILTTPSGTAPTANMLVYPHFVL